MAMVRRSGQTVPAMRDSTETERSTALDNSFGLMVQLIMVTSLRITFTVRVSILGPMVVSTTASGNTTKWTVLECLPGATAVNTRVPTWTTRKKDMECSLGQMVASTMVTGEMVSSTETESTTQ